MLNNVLHIYVCILCVCSDAVSLFLNTFTYILMALCCTQGPVADEYILLSFFKWINKKIKKIKELDELDILVSRKTTIGTLLCYYPCNRVIFLFLGLSLSLPFLVSCILTANSLEHKFTLSCFLPIKLWGQWQTFLLKTSTHSSVSLSILDYVIKSTKKNQSF